MNLDELQRLAEEPPLYRCTSCGRKSWSESERGKFCNMPQPSNRRCSGIMAAIRSLPLPESDMTQARGE